MEQPADGKTEEQLLLEYLSSRDVACPRCAYNLRALTSPRCPECGEELKLKIATTEPYLKAWITLAASIAALAGVGILFLCLITRFGWPPYMRISGDIATVFSFVSPVLLWPVIALRRKFAWMPRSAQWVIAVIAFAASAIAVMFIVTGIR